jgi:hypothetical protein
MWQMGMRNSSAGNDFTLRQALLVSHPNGFCLRFRQLVESMLQAGAQIPLLEFRIPICHMLRQRAVFFLLAETHFGAVVRLEAANAIKGAATGQRNQPAQGAAFLLRVVFGAIPDFDEDLLEKILGMLLVIDTPANHRLEQFAVAVVEHRQRRFVALLNACHQRLIGWFCLLGSVF